VIDADVTYRQRGGLGRGHRFVVTHGPCGREIGAIGPRLRHDKPIWLIAIPPMSIYAKPGTLPYHVSRDGATAALLAAHTCPTEETPCPTS
jgi:hypothetical protein